MRFVRVAPPVLLLGFSVLCAGIAIRKSATYDESHYIGVGRYVLTHLDWNIRDATLHPLLSVVLHDLPLLTMSIPEDVWEEPNGDLRGQRIIALRPDDRVLGTCRLAMLPAGICLGWLVYRWSKQRNGEAGGLLSLFLFCVSPNILAHAALITPDVTLACTTVFTLDRLRCLARTWSRSNLVLAGVAMGLMLLSKYTALLMLPILFVTDVAFRAAAGTIDARHPAPAWRELRHWPWLLLQAGALVWAAYLFDVGPLALPGAPPVPVPAAPYVNGALFQWMQSREPHSFFLMGMHSTTGWWYYYLVVLLIKAPLGTLLLLAGLALAPRRLGLRFVADDVWLVVPFVLLLIYLSCFSTLHNGIRYLLPVYPLLLVLIGKYGVAVSRSRPMRVVVCALALWVAGSSLRVWPHHLAYFNELIGGPRNGYHWLGDSNLDWGQDLAGLKRYMTSNRIERIRLSYFGTADPARYGIDYDPLPAANVPPHPLPRRSGAAPPSPIVALSAYQYQAIGFADKSIYSAFYAYEPNDTVGYSILIYDTNAPIPRQSAPLTTRIRSWLAPEQARRFPPASLGPRLGETSRVFGPPR